MTATPNLLTPAIVTAASSHAEQKAALARMTRDERLGAYHRGELTWTQLFSWAARWPDEPPLLNGEYEFITLALADVDETPAKATP